MAAIPDGEGIGCTFQWQITNAGQCWWWLRKGERIESPAFVADGLAGTKWSLWLYPMGRADEDSLDNEELIEEDENGFGILLHRDKYCGGPDAIEVYFQLAFLGKDGLIVAGENPAKVVFMKNEHFGFSKFEELETVFVTQREAFLPEDTLNVMCSMWITDEKPNKTNYVFTTTVIKVKRRSFVWRIDKPDALESSRSCKFKDSLIGFDLILNKNVDRLNMDLNYIDESVKYISCNTSIIDVGKRRENCGIQKYFGDDLKRRVLSSMVVFPEMLIENKWLYFPNEVLTLDFEFVLLTQRHFGFRKSFIELKSEVVGKEKCQINDFISLYNDHTFSDLELRTSTKIFTANKSILSARSPVFRCMFSSDMKEKSSGQVDIPDLDDDTIDRMLLYIYTNSLEDLQFESASKLYTAADKYQILPLKSRCSSILNENLCPANACSVLVLADLHNDDDLKRAVQDCMLIQPKQFFCSEEWNDFMNNHLQMAADIMYKKLTKSAMHLV